MSLVVGAVHRFDGARGQKPVHTTVLAPSLPTANSRAPSPSTSPQARARTACPVLMSACDVKVPAPSLVRTWV